MQPQYEFQCINGLYNILNQLASSNKLCLVSELPLITFIGNHRCTDYYYWANTLIQSNLHYFQSIHFYQFCIP